MADVARNKSNAWFRKENHVKLSKNEVTKKLILDAGVDRAASQGVTIDYLSLYDADGFRPELVADFNREYYRRHEEASSFSNVVNHTGGTLISDGWSMNSATDILTIPASNVPYNTTAITVAIKGLMTYADTDSFREAMFTELQIDANNQHRTFINTNGTNTGKFFSRLRTGGANDDVTSATDNYFTPGTDKPFSIAVTIGAAIHEAALDGVALTNSGGTPVSPDFTAVDLGICGLGVMTIEQVVVWGQDIGAAGRVAASA